MVQSSGSSGLSYCTILAIFSANFPTLVPPYFCTTQFPPPGRFFSFW